MKGKSKSMTAKKREKREKWDNPDTEVLFAAILRLRNTNEARRFFRDLLTERELIEFGHRWKAARMLDRGVPYSEIGKQTWLSSTTIARVKKWLSRGMGGYQLMIERLDRE